MLKLVNKLKLFPIKQENSKFWENCLSKYRPGQPWQCQIWWHATPNCFQINLGTVTKFGGSYLHITELTNVQSQRGHFLCPFSPPLPTPRLSRDNPRLILISRVDVWGMLFNRKTQTFQITSELYFDSHRLTKNCEAFCKIIYCFQRKTVMLWS